MRGVPLGTHAGPSTTLQSVLTFHHIKAGSLTASADVLCAPGELAHNLPGNSPSSHFPSHCRNAAMTDTHATTSSSLHSFQEWTWVTGLVRLTRVRVSHLLGPRNFNYLKILPMEKRRGKQTCVCCEFTANFWRNLWGIYPCSDTFGLFQSSIAEKWSHAVERAHHPLGQTTVKSGHCPVPQVRPQGVQFLPNKSKPIKADDRR